MHDAADRHAQNAASRVRLAEAPADGPTGQGQAAEDCLPFGTRPRAAWNTGDSARMQDLPKLAPKFGWNVTPEQIKNAADYLQKLGLVELTE